MTQLPVSPTFAALLDRHGLSLDGLFGDGCDDVDTSIFVERVESAGIHDEVMEGLTKGLEKLKLMVDTMGNESHHAESTLDSRKARLCRSGTVTLYHQTSAEFADTIIRTQTMKRGTSGMAGGGIYFATCPEDTDHKAHHRGPILRCEVSLGNIKRIPSEGDDCITFSSLLSEGMDSVMIPRTGDEYVVYNSDQVVGVSYHRR